MGPLDLTKQKPRGPREMLAGLVFMPRTVDKLRAEQPGGDMGAYLNRPDGLSAYMCKKVGLDMDDLRAQVARAQDEAELEVWLQGRLDPVAVAEVNSKMPQLGIHKLNDENVARVKHYHPILNERPDLVYFFDIFEADEA
ncbi:MAG TPA: DUF5069 domain-containing protein [Candidatus Sulfotelmatobacter sp.]|nr:DUF5069 domain-containing protein [Candidatus Sulfotelmatobacter sp.]